ncbi:pleckstrin homology domain-containing family M member 1 [Culicoides brevitarsis]|uniref:pleckstrin homology domain-containing family M member 1 n=1 Tax=Culicoides brevitarsis TaxID=469753 RepID=UPI00307CBBB1
MNFFTSNTQIKEAKDERDRLVKQKIFTCLRENIEIIVLEAEQSLNSSQDYTEFCCGLEALFLHGLKHSLFSITVDFLSTSNLDRRPEPSFMNVLMTIAHRDIITSLQQKTQLNSDIAYCRAFIRQILNDNTLSSYLTMIVNSPRTLTSYYYKYAFLRDKVLVLSILKLIEPMETKAAFKFNINTSLLNQWPNMTLELSGIWSVARKSLQIDNAEDVASSLPKDHESYLRRYTKTPAIEFSVSPAASACSDKMTPSSVEDACLTETYSERPSLLLFPPRLHDEDQVSMSDSQILMDDDGIRTAISPQVSPMSPEHTPDIDSAGNRRETDLDKYDLSTLLEKYKTHNEKSVEKKAQPGIKEVWSNFESNMIKVKEDDDSEKGESEDDWDKMDPNSFYKSKKYKLVDLQPLVEQLCMLTNEVGLDGQDFKCKKCSTPISIDFEGTQICSFSGYYYCDNCMSKDLCIIPSRVIYNWDFRKYNVNADAANFFKEFRYEPFIDIDKLNPDYTKIKMMHRLKNLRLKLNSMSQYMINCETVTNTFKEMLGYREYFFNFVHKYSIADFEMLADGQFENMLSSAVDFGFKHILNCQLCSQQGFICEICSDQTIIYPFDLDNTVQCTECSNLYHKMCYTTGTSCSRCERKKKRLESMNEEAGVEECVEN